MAKQKKTEKTKPDVHKLFELQSDSGWHLAWASNEEECKETAQRLLNGEASLRAAEPEVRVYQLLGTFTRPAAPAVWKKLVR